jgi:ATP-dependent RNA helicase SUPV3L1/SUV3
VAFAGGAKFDGRAHRPLFPAEVAQIAGRAGRHIRNGTWGTTADCRPFADEVVDQVEDHRFEPVTALQWRNPVLDFRSLPSLLRSLEAKPPRTELIRARMDDDEEALRRLTRRHDIRDMAKGGAALKLLWEVCQVPDFRKVTPDQHAVMLGEIYHQLLDRGRIPEAFTASQLQKLDRLDGDVDTLSNRIAHVRTWTYLSHRPGWLDRAVHWQDEARRIEDALSDTLHEKLTQRFIDRRTSVLLKKLKDDVPLLAAVTADGEVIVEGEFVGRLLGFQFILDPRAKGPQAKAVRFAALRALKPELAARAAALAAAQFHEFSLRDGGAIWWRQSIIAELIKGPQPLRPGFRLVATEHLPAHAVPQIEDRVRDFLADRVEGLVGPLVSLQKAVNEVSEAPEALGPAARGVAFRLIENFGAVSRHSIGDEIKALPQDERAKLRKLGVRFGEYTIHIPALLKPAPAQFLALLWALWEEKAPGSFVPPQPGATSVPNDKTVPAPLYLASGYRPSGSRAVRIDMLERLAGEIRTARDQSGREGFEANARMMSLVGCSGEEFESILQSLGFKKATVTKDVPKRVGLKARDTGTATQTATPDGIAEAPAIAHAAAEEANEPPSAPAEQTESTPAADVAGEDASAVTAVESAPEETETVEVTVWRWAPPRARRDGNKRPAPGKRDNAEGDRQPDSRRKAKGPRKGPKSKNADRKADTPRTFSSGPKRNRKEPDPDSPFAVLAALKDKS